MKTPFQHNSFSALHYRESFNNIMWLCVMCYSLVNVMMHQTPAVESTADPS